MGASDMAHLFLGNLEQVLSLKENLAADYDSRRIRDQAKDGESTDAFSAGALANQTYTLTFFDMIGKTVVRSNFSLFGVEIGSKVFDF